LKSSRPINIYNRDFDQDERPKADECLIVAEVFLITLFIWRSMDIPINRSL